MTAAAVPAPRVTQRQAFTAVLHRDLFVTWKELPVFLAQVILQPLFLLLVFSKVLGALGYTSPGYADLLFPGLLSLTAVLTGMQTLAFPLVIEFGSPPTDESYPSVHAAALCAMLATAPGGRWHQYVSRSVVGDLDQVVLGQAGLGYHLPSGVRRSGSSLQTRHLALEPGFEI